MDSQRVQPSSKRHLGQSDEVFTRSTVLNQATLPSIFVNPWKRGHFGAKRVLDGPLIAWYLDATSYVILQ